MKCSTTLKSGSLLETLNSASLLKRCGFFPTVFIPLHPSAKLVCEHQEANNLSINESLQENPCRAREMKVIWKLSLCSFGNVLDRVQLHSTALWMITGLHKFQISVSSLALKNTGFCYETFNLTLLRKSGQDS